jgi:hypothetical protein
MKLLEPVAVVIKRAHVILVLDAEPSSASEEPVLLLSMPLGDEESQGAPMSGAVGN